MTAPFLKPIPRLRCTRIACAGGLLLCLLGQDASAADVLVVTDSRHPVQSASGARVIELDLPERIEAELAATGHVTSRRLDVGAENDSSALSISAGVAASGGLDTAMPVPCALCLLSPERG